MRGAGRKHPHDPRSEFERPPPAITRRVRRIGWTALGLVLVAALTAGGVLLLSGDDGGGHGGGAPPNDSAARTTSTPTPATSRPPPARNPSKDSTRREVHAAVAQSSVARLDPVQRRVAGVARAYVGALDARDGAPRLPALRPGSALSSELPAGRGTCAATMSASIGYRDPRGFPVFAGVRVARIAGVTIDGPQARVVATTVTRFADNREPSVEDDLIYLRPRGRTVADREAQRDALPRDRRREHPAAGPRASPVAATGGSR